MTNAETHFALVGAHHQPRRVHGLERHRRWGVHKSPPETDVRDLQLLRAVKGREQVPMNVVRHVAAPVAQTSPHKRPADAARSRASGKGGRAAEDVMSIKETGPAEACRGSGGWLCKGTASSGRRLSASGMSNLSPRPERP